MMKLSIGLRLTLWYVIIFAVAQLFFAGGMWLILRHNLHRMTDEALRDQVDDLTKFLEAQKKDATVAKLQEEVSEAYVLEHSGDYLQIYDGDGVWIYRSGFLQQHPVTAPDPGAVNQVSREDRQIGGQRFRFITQHVRVNGRDHIVQTALPIDQVVRILSWFRLCLWLFAPGLFLAAAAGGYWLSRRALAPVDALTRTAQAISGNDLSGRLETLRTGDELQRLSDTLNEMLGRIESSFLRVTQFTADASHELRTPLALMRTEAELALRKSRSPVEYREALRHILVESERTTLLIEELLSLARADSGRETLNLRCIDLRETLADVVAGWRQIATARDLHFTGRVDPEVWVLADTSAVRRLVNILLDNAFKYTPSLGKVHLSVERAENQAVISVRDDGAGIAESEQAKIFERFYRADKARNREGGGAGLGLAIAQWVAVQHHGTITVESQLGKGSIFQVKLPLMPAPVRSHLVA